MLVTNNFLPISVLLQSRYGSSDLADILASGSKKFDPIPANKVGLKKVQDAYDRMAKEISYPGNTPRIKTDAMKVYSKEIIAGMEEFIISKASKESLSEEGSKELPFNERYPNLRAPSFQSCIDAVYSYQEELDKLQPHPHFHLGKMKAIVDEFKKRANELNSLSTDEPNQNPLRIIFDLYDDPFENSDSEAPAERRTPPRAPYLTSPRPTLSPEALHLGNSALFFG